MGTALGLLAVPRPWPVSVAGRCRRSAERVGRQASQQHPA
jgi:hypothetical protein